MVRRMQDVIIVREKLVIPSYVHAAAEKSPMFYELRNNQSTRGNVYPYPMIDKLSDTLVDKEYDSIRLENEFLRVVVLPELGGRVYEGYDKSGDYHFVYKNNVIKPALIGLLGAWVSGGIEFNWPQHHRPTTFAPVDAVIEENADGSKTAWMGEIELLSGTKGMVGITLYPGLSVIQAKARIYNRTPEVKTFHWWANLAVHTNENYQLRFPPDVDYITTHYKPAVTTFPKLSGEYMGQDYGDDGPDVSWYRNVELSASFFIFNSNYSFMGGYDHGRRRGTVHVADRYVSPGKKFFTWGLNEFGQAWQRNLTDNDGPYLEIMTGCYTDNQPDFAFLHPYETKTFTQHWYGLNNMPNLVNASVEGAVSLSAENGSAQFALNSTRARKGAKAVLSAGGNILFEETIDISPGEPWSASVPLADGVGPDDIKAEFIDADGTPLVSYQKQPAYFEETGAPAAHPPGRKPRDIETLEELYLEGLHIEQYRHPTWAAEPYYLEALRRDPGDARCNNAMGNVWFRRGDYAKAVCYYKKSVERLITRNANPYDGEPYFNLGLALRHTGRDGEAMEAFKKAAWSYAWRAPALEQCAVLYMRKGNWEGALNDALEASRTNAQSLHLRMVMAAAMRKLGMKDDAVNMCGDTIALDRLDYASRHELYLLTGDAAELETLNKILADRVPSRLSLAGDYLDMALYDEALAVLDGCVESPMKYYYKAYALKALGLYAAEALETAGKTNPDYCFPSTHMDIATLENARLSHGGGLAPYLLGLIYYARDNADTAIERFEESVMRSGACGGEQCEYLHAARRCLAHAYHDKRGDFAGAAREMEAAFALRGSVRYLLELNQLYKITGLGAKERLALLDGNIHLVEERDDLYLAYISLLNLNGRSDLAAKKLASHIFHPYEGGEGILMGEHIRTYILLGRKTYADKDYAKALELFKNALVIPLNYNEGRTPVNFLSMAYYSIATACGALGDAAGHGEWLGKACAAEVETDEAGYFKGMALRESGRPSQAQALFERMLLAADQLDALGDSFPYFTGFPVGLAFEQSKLRVNRIKSRASRYYAYLGLGRKAEAEKAKKALDELGEFYMFLE